MHEISGTSFLNQSERVVKQDQSNSHILYTWVPCWDPNCLHGSYIGTPTVYMGPMLGPQLYTWVPYWGPNCIHGSHIGTPTVYMGPILGPQLYTWVPYWDPNCIHGSHVGTPTVSRKYSELTLFALFL